MGGTELLSERVDLSEFGIWKFQFVWFACSVEFHESVGSFDEEILILLLLHLLVVSARLDRCVK